MTHHCHWPGCPVDVPPKQWGCKAHWFALPKRLRDKVWATYRPGQEVTKTPSRAYVEVAREVQQWILSQQPKASTGDERLPTVKRIYRSRPME